MLKDGHPRIAGILIFAFAIRLGWALLQPRSDAGLAQLPDQMEYLSLGRNLLYHGTLCFVDPRFNQTIWAYRMPGYPAVIAACGGSALVVRILQGVIDVGTVLAVYLIAESSTRGSDRSTGVSPVPPVARATASPSQIAGTPIAGEDSRRLCSLVAAILIALNPFYVYFSGLILSETIFTALLAWGLWSLVRRRWLLAAVCLTTACYFRPAAVFIAPVLVAIAAANSASGSSYRWMPSIPRGLIAGLSTGLVLMVALLPWAWRNHQRLGSWIWTTTNGGVTLYDGFSPAATGASDQRFLSRLPAVWSMNEVERSVFLAHSARGWAAGHLGQLPLLSLRKVLRSWSPVPLSSEFARPVYRLISAVYAIPFDVLWLIGLCSRRISREMKLLLIMPAVLITVIEVLSVGSIRYRIPAEAPLAVLAGAGFMTVAGLLRGEPARPCPGADHR